jgi:hypothetical protein
MLNIGLSLSPQYLMFLFNPINTAHTMFLLQHLNETSFMRCILVKALLTTLKSPQSSGTKFQRNFQMRVKPRVLVQLAMLIQ